MTKISSLLRTLVIIAIAVVSTSSARGAGPPRSFSAADLDGTYAFRTSGNSLFTSPDEVTSSPGFLAAVGVCMFDGVGRLKEPLR